MTVPPPADETRDAVERIGEEYIGAIDHPIFRASARLIDCSMEIGARIKTGDQLTFWQQRRAEAWAALDAEIQAYAARSRAAVLASLASSAPEEDRELAWSFADAVYHYRQSGKTGVTANTHWLEHVVPAETALLARLAALREQVDEWKAAYEAQMVDQAMVRELRAELDILRTTNASQCQTIEWLGRRLELYGGRL